jgi:hypothetical protein
VALLSCGKQLMMHAVNLVPWEEPCHPSPRFTRLTEADVAEGRAANFESITAVLQDNVRTGLPLVEVLTSGREPAPARAAAARALETNGAVLTRLHHLLCIWNSGTYIATCCRWAMAWSYESAGSPQVYR